MFGETKLKIMEKRVEKAIDIFLDAINNGTLAKGTCSACAVGNLVAHEMGTTPRLVFGWEGIREPNGFWGFVMGGSSSVENMDKGRANIESTDFNIKELLKIERAFENESLIHVTRYKTYSKKEIRADQINGLEAVVKVMLDFTNDESDVKEVFTKKAELIEL